MGGKGGGGSSVMQQDYGQYGGDGDNKGGFVYSATGTTTPPEFEKTPAAPKAEEPKVTEDPSKAGGAEKIDAETQPYAPPGWGNYPKTGTNLSPLGDMLVSGMQAQPGKAGPTAPNYVGQV